MDERIRQVNDLAKQEAALDFQRPVQQPTEISAFMRIAVEKGDVATIDKLASLYERAAEKSAEQQFNSALTAFQNEAKVIGKNRKVEYVNKSGVKTAYGFVDFEHLTEQIRPLLDKHGLAFSHDTSIDEKQMMTVTCTLRHVLGHREKSSFTLPTTAQTPAMSDQQRYAAALTFARRYTLIQALGLATGEIDADEVHEAAGPTITEAQAQSLYDMLVEVGADLERFKAIYKIAALTDLPVSKLDDAMAKIEAKRKGKK